MSENVKPKQVRPRRSEQLRPQLDSGDVAKYLTHALGGFNMPKIDISDIEQVKERCEWYFQHCIDDDIRPTVAGLSNALGITRQTFHRWCVGSERGRTHTEYAQRIRSIMEEMMEDYMLNGKINPVSGIFLMKNNYGYTDKSEVVLTPNSPFDEPTSTEELERKYLDVISLVQPELEDEE